MSLMISSGTYSSIRNNNIPINMQRCQILSTSTTSICSETNISNSLFQLDDLSDVECKQILTVLRKNNELIEMENLRLRILESQIKKEAVKENLIRKRNKNNWNNCVRCYRKFMFLVNPKRTCYKCNFNICKNCCLVIIAKSNLYICTICNTQEYLETSYWISKKSNYFAVDLDALSSHYNIIENLFDDDFEQVYLDSTKEINYTFDSMTESKENDSGIGTSWKKNVAASGEKVKEVPNVSYVNSSKIAPTTLKYLQTDHKVMDELYKFKEDFISFLNKLEVDSLTFDALENDEIDRLIYSSKSDVCLIITNFVQSLHASLEDSNSDRDRLEYDIKLIVIAEIEECLKIDFGSLLKDLEQSVDENDYPRAFEDELSNLLLNKLLHTTNINKSASQSKSNQNFVVRQNDDEKRAFTLNDNLMLTFNSIGSKGELYEDSFLETYEIDDYIMNEAIILDDKSPIKENWSFNDIKKRQLFNAQNTTPVVMTIPEPNTEVPTRLGELDTESLSDVNFNEHNYYESVSISRRISDSSSISEYKSESGKKTPLMSKKFPLPGNLMLNRPFASSSVYKPNNRDSFYGDTESEIAFSMLSSSNSRNNITEHTRIGPNMNVDDPKFIVLPEDRLARSGETVKFKCKVDGTQPLAVFWFKMEGEELQNNEKYEIYHDNEYHYLKIYNTKKEEDTGAYLCVVSNELQQNYVGFYLKLRDNNRNYIEPRFQLQMHDTEVVEGSTAIFKVNVDFGYPKARVLFYRNELPLSNDHKHQISYYGDGAYELIVDDVGDSDNAQYACVCINNAGKIVSKAELYVTEKEVVQKPEIKIRTAQSMTRELKLSERKDEDKLRGEIEPIIETTQFIESRVLEIKKKFSIDDSVKEPTIDAHSIKEVVEVRRDSNARLIKSESIEIESKTKLVNDTSTVPEPSQQDDEVFNSYISQIQFDYVPTPVQSIEIFHNDVILKDAPFEHQTSNDDSLSVIQSEEKEKKVEEILEEPKKMEKTISSPPSPSTSESKASSPNNAETIFKFPKEQTQTKNIFQTSPNVVFEVIEKSPSTNSTKQDEVKSPIIVNEPHPDDISHEALANSNMVKMLKQKFNIENSVAKTDANITSKTIVGKKEPLTSTKSSVVVDQHKSPAIRINISPVAGEKDTFTYKQPEPVKKIILPKIEVKTPETADSKPSQQSNIIRRESNDKVVRLLHHLAENQKFCKVYDSVNDVTLKQKYKNEENPKFTSIPASSASQSAIVSPSTSVAHALLVESVAKNTPISVKNTQIEQKQLKIDSNKIIQANFENVRRKDSVVLSKVRLWDKSIESGEFNTDHWDEEFIAKKDEKN